MAGIPAETLKELRENALKSLYFFAKGVLGYDRLNARIHKPLCRLLEKAQELLPKARGYARDQLAQGIALGNQVRAELADLDKERPPIYAKIIRMLILLGEGGLYD